LFRKKIKKLYFWHNACFFGGGWGAAALTATPFLGGS